MFAYDPTSGVVKPIWTTDSDSTTPSDKGGSTTNQLQADVNQASSDSAMSTASSLSSTTASSTISSMGQPVPTGNVDSTNNAMRRNVTLVFTPAVPAVNVVEGTGTASVDGRIGGAADSGMTNDQTTMLPSSLSSSAPTSSSSLPATTVSSGDSTVSSPMSSSTVASMASSRV